MSINTNSEIEEFSISARITEQTSNLLQKRECLEILNKLKMEDFIMIQEKIDYEDFHDSYNKNGKDHTILCEIQNDLNLCERTNSVKTSDTMNYEDDNISIINSHLDYCINYWSSAFFSNAI